MNKPKTSFLIPPECKCPVRQPEPQPAACPACAAKRVHTADEWQWHPVQDGVSEGRVVKAEGKPL